MERGDHKAAVGNLEAAASKMTAENETIRQALVEAYRENSQPQEAQREAERLQALQSRRTQVSLPNGEATSTGTSTKPN